MPVYLWEFGLGLSGLCALVGVSGLAFAAALGPWQRIARERPLAHLIGCTFGLELALVLAVALAAALLGHGGERGAGGGPGSGADTWSVLVAATLVGLVNGAYNAFYWTTQRALFADLGRRDDAGRRYGNLQIVVAVFLKLGILGGGLLLDAGALHWILALSAFASVAATLALWRDAGSAPLVDEPVVRWRRSLAWRDGSGSAGVFAVDGLFLYLESHFWTLSLFLLVREDHSRLGVVVVALGIAFALLFLLIKNRIDRPATIDAVYRASVALYALSWLLRAALDDAAALGGATLAALLGVTFCSSLFRLAFNKRFFDSARDGAGARNGTGPGPPGPPGQSVQSGRTGPSEPLGQIGYLVVKSHVSQLWMGAIFLPLAAFVHASALSPERLLDALYVAAALLSLVYLRYRRPAPARRDEPGHAARPESGPC